MTEYHLIDYQYMHTIRAISVVINNTQISRRYPRYLHKTKKQPTRATNLVVLLEKERNGNRDEVVAEVELWSCNQQLTQTTNSDSPQTLDTRHTHSHAGMAFNRPGSLPPSV